MIAPAYPLELPAGIELPDGRVLTYAPHRECPCVDRREAYRALLTRRLLVPDSEALPW